MLKTIIQSFTVYDVTNCNDIGLCINSLIYDALEVATGVQNVDEKFHVEFIRN